jgi:hypothetical protein
MGITRARKVKRSRSDRSELLRMENAERKRAHRAAIEARLKEKKIKSAIRRTLKRQPSDLASLTPEQERAYGLRTRKLQRLRSLLDAS